MAASQIKQVNLDMSYKGLFRGDYIAAAEFGGREPTLKIAHVQFERLPSLGNGTAEGAEAQEKDRAVVYFESMDRGWVLNRTNAECLGAMFGSVLRDWIGKRVTLVAEQVRDSCRLTSCSCPSRSFRNGSCVLIRSLTTKVPPATS